MLWDSLRSENSGKQGCCGDDLRDLYQEPLLINIISLSYKDRDVLVSINQKMVKVILKHSFFIIPYILYISL